MSKIKNWMMDMDEAMGEAILDLGYSDLEQVTEYVKERVGGNISRSYIKRQMQEAGLI